MPTTYYYAGRDGDSFTDATIHTDQACADGEREDASARPISGASLSDPDLCGECAGGDTTDDDGGDGGVCTVTKSDGEECGRERPCPYHDKR